MSHIYGLPSRNHSIARSQNISALSRPESPIYQSLSRFQPALKPPGPATYNLNPPKLTKGCIFDRSKRIRPSANNPAPTDYVPNDLYRSKGVSFQRSKRKEQRSDTPSPDKYRPEKLVHPEQVIFDKRKRSEIVSKDKAIIPGPGTYTIVTRKNESLSFPRRIRFSPSQETLKSPGPGDYKPNSFQVTSPSSSFSRAKRYSSQGKASPGPASYETPKQAKMFKGGVIGRQAVRLMEKPEGPGPGTYLDVSLQKTKNKSIGIVIPQYEGKKRMTTEPSPLSYMPNYHAIEGHRPSAVINRPKGDQRREQKSGGNDTNGLINDLLRISSSYHHSMSIKQRKQAKG